MATKIGHQSYSFRDAKGYIWVLSHYINYQDDTATHEVDARQVAANVEAALTGTGPGTLALTNGALQKLTGPLSNANFTLAYGTAAQYLNAEDKLEVALVTASGAVHRFGIGSPVTAAFLADQETGKASQLADFVTAMTGTVGTGPAFACSKDGSAFTAAIGSLLIRRRQRRKVNLYTKSSNLDEPGE